MKVGNVCKHNVVTVRERDGLRVAAELMRTSHVGYLIVVEPGANATQSRPIGVLTDRDIVVSVVSQGADPHALRVGDLMSRRIDVVEEDLPVSSALVQMRKHGRRRLPVVSADGNLVGVLSLDDVLDAIGSEIDDVTGAIRNELLVESASLR